MSSCYVSSYLLIVYYGVCLLLCLFVIGLLLRLLFASLCFLCFCFLLLPLLLMVCLLLWLFMCDYCFFSLFVVSFLFIFMFCSVPY